MSTRPRRAAAQRANKTITDMIDSDKLISSRTGKIMSSRTSRRSEVKLPASKLRQATSSRPALPGRQSTRDSFSGGEIIEGKRNRSQKKSYIVETSDDDDDAPGDDDDEDAEGDDDDAMDEDEDVAEREIVVDGDTMDMDLDAEGDDDDEDAEGEDDDMELDAIPPPAPVIKVSKPSAKSSGINKRGVARPTTTKATTSHVRDSDDDDELSELESEADEIQDTVKVGGGDEEDAEGEDEEIGVAGAAEDDDDLGSDDDGSQGETPDLTKMTKRQRARFEENGDAALMKLSDEVQAKKHFTAEELSMRRAEMARRRRNLSEKRNEEVKMETINKLLKKQAPKTKGRGQGGLEGTPDIDAQKPSPIFVRWVSNKDGNRVAVPDEMLAGPAGRVFAKR